MTALPSSARAVVVGGGIVGCSTAYHLVKAGWREVVLLERHRLTSGTTFHAAGLVGQLRSNANITRLLTYSVELYDRLEAETGLSPGWTRNGSLRLAATPERMIELKRAATTARSFGLEMELLSPREAGELWPLLRTDDLVGAAWFPGDGQAQPSDLTQSLAKGARDGGARLIEGVAVTGFETEGERVTAVLTDQGRIACEAVALCAGQWSPELGRLAGIDVPLHPVQHQYLITESIPGITRGLPSLRDPDSLLYYKEEVGGLVVGGYEPEPKAWAERGIPEGFHFSLLDFDWEQFEPLMSEAPKRIPALETAGVKSTVNGPESFTPDGNFILGDVPGLRNLYLGAGFNAFGIASGGGAGWALAGWITEGQPPFDLSAVDVRRFGAPHRSRAWLRARTLEATGRHYLLGWPHEEYRSGRPERRSPLYDRLAARGAVFGEKLGWERPNWFAGPGEEPRDIPSFGRANWFEAVGREHRACRSTAALFDQSSFAKFLLQGPDAGEALSRLCANRVVRGAGRVTYTQLLNERGGIQCDLTVTQLDEQRFYIVTGTGSALRDFDWIRRNLPAGARAELVDVTSAFATLSLMGPEAPAILQAVTEDRVDGRYGSAHEIAIGGASVRALRLSYVGEPGWELHLPAEQAVAVYERLQAAGAEHGLVDAGYRAIESLRLEKGFLAWGSDIGPGDTPLQAGLGFAVKLEDDRAFIGRAALEAQAAAPLDRRLARFALDDPAVTLLGRETIYRDGERVGWLTSGGWGYSLETNLGQGYVRRPEGVDDTFLASGDWELEVACERHPCRVLLRSAA